jgi:multidrug efflux pump subunit AcrA (membrane-fusion protein)
MMVTPGRFSTGRAISGLLLLMLGCTLYFTRWGLPANESTPPTPAGTSDSTAMAQRLIFAAGIVEGASEPLDVHFEIPGRIQLVHVRDGQKVSRDDVLATLNSDAEDLAVEMAETELRLAKFQQAHVSTSGSPGKAQQVTFTSEQQTVEQQEAAIRVELAQLALQKEQLLLRKTQLHSPIDGVIVECQIRPGQLTDQQGSAAFRIVDRSRTRVRAWVEELDAMDVTPGMSAAIVASGAMNRRFRGSVISCANYVQPKSVRHLNPGERVDVRVREIVIEVKDGEELLLGLPVEVFIAPQKNSRSKETEEHRTPSKDTARR